MGGGGGTSTKEEGRGSSTGEIIWLTDKLEEAFSCSLCCIRILSVGNAINIVVSPKSGIFSLDFSCILLCCLLNVYRSDEDRTEQKFYMH